MEDPNLIPYFGLDRQYKNLREEILDASDKVYSSGIMLDGAFVDTFEDEIEAYTGRTYAVAVNSCTTALFICYLYYAAQCPGKSVALPALSFIATANAPAFPNWNLTFIDVDQNGILDLDKIDVHQDKIDVLSYVNLYGNVINYDKLTLVSSFFHNLIVIEDAAQSFGASYKGIKSGKLGTVSVLSFDPTKNLANYGSGGMLLTDDPLLFQFARSFRNNGKGSDHVGVNLRMSEADCAQMLVKLRHFDAWQERRAKIAQFYTDCLHPYVECPTVNQDVVHAWHKYVINTVDQFQIVNCLTNNQIESKVHYSRILPSLPMFSRDGDWPMASELTGTSVGLPIYPELLDSEVMRIVETIQKVYD